MGKGWFIHINKVKILTQKYLSGFFSVIYIICTQAAVGLVGSHRQCEANVNKIEGLKGVLSQIYFMIIKNKICGQRHYKKHVLDSSSVKSWSWPNQKPSRDFAVFTAT